ncbi:MAG: hypothetical protein ACPGEG_06675 [Salibacteraceae bacterium]
MKTAFISRILTLILSISLVLPFQSCDKDLDINADYEAYPIVYGLLNTYDSIQTVRINKSFLGDANPAGYAKIADSSLFSNVSIDLIETRVQLDDNGQEFNRYERVRYPLSKMTITGKEDGVFSNPEQVVYGAQLPPAKTQNSESLRYLHQSIYNRGDGGVSERVEYSIEGTVGDNKTIKATMSPIPEHTQDIMTQKPFRSKWNSTKDGNIAFALDNKLSDGIFMEVEIPPFAKITELKFIFNYTDIDLDGNEIPHQISQSMGTYTTSELSEFPKDKFEFSIGAERFFELVASQVPDFNETTPAIKKRIPGIVDFEIVVGDAEYYYYRSNTIPSSDLNQLKPQYTNIEGGFGIFASRTIITMSEWAISSGNVLDVKGLTGLWLDKNTQIALQTGSIDTKDGTVDLKTGLKGFCLNNKVVGIYTCPNPNVECKCD